MQTPVQTSSQTFLSSAHFSATSRDESQSLENALQHILEQDYQCNFYAMFARYQRILADNGQRHAWPVVHKKLETLFKCGKAEVISGPMIGIPVSIRDSDYFRNLDHNGTGECL